LFTTTKSVEFEFVSTQLLTRLADRVALNAPVAVPSAQFAEPYPTKSATEEFNGQPFPAN